MWWLALIAIELAVVLEASVGGNVGLAAVFVALAITLLSAVCQPPAPRDDRRPW